MGEYWFPVNATRKEFVHAHTLNCGLKLAEWTYPGSPVLAVVAKWAATDSVYLQSDYDDVIEVTGAPEVAYSDMRDTFMQVTDAPGAPDEENVRRLIAAAAHHIGYAEWHDEWREHFKAQEVQP